MATTYKARSTAEPLDFASANFLGLILAVVILVAFIFMPWMWTEIKYNGARLMSDVLTGGSLKTYGSSHLVLIPITALLTVGLAMWGLLSAHRGALASVLTVATGVMGLAYYFDVYFIQEGQVAEYIRANIGIGFKVTLVAMVGLVAQVILLAPDVNRGLQRLSHRLAFLRPAVPQRAVPYLFLLVPLALYLVWIIGPTLYTFYLSLTNWDGVSDPKYIGIKNYRTLFDQSTFTEALGNNVRWLIAFITVPTTMGLGLAMIFNTEMRGGRGDKVSSYSPVVLS